MNDFFENPGILSMVIVSAGFVLVMYINDKSKGDGGKSEGTAFYVVMFFLLLFLSVFFFVLSP